MNIKKNPIDVQPDTIDEPKQTAQDIQPVDTVEVQTLSSDATETTAGTKKTTFWGAQPDNQALNANNEAEQAKIDPKETVEQEADKKNQKEIKQCEKNLEQKKKLIEQDCQERLQEGTKRFKAKQQQITEAFNIQTSQIQDTIDKQVKQAQEAYKQKKHDLFEVLNKA